MPFFLTNFEAADFGASLSGPELVFRTVAESGLLTGLAIYARFFLRVRTVECSGESGQLNFPFWLSRVGIASLHGTRCTGFHDESRNK